MRPQRLELIGFGAFLDRTVVDFQGADLFALTGSTGSGKTTILDAITFALYGSVPRHRKGEVAPIISQTGSEAKVRLDFTIGERSFSAVRVVRRNKTGANTDEAVLESAGEMLASNADELTAKVTELLGLTFDEFSRCVILPQGDFARFLRDDQPKERRGLLIALLELGVYEQVAQLAGLRQREAEGAAKAIAAQLEAMADITPESLAAVGERVGRLANLLIEVDRRQPELDALEARLASIETEVVSIAGQVTRLETLGPPPELESLLDRQRRSDEHRAAAQAGYTQVAAEVDRLSDQISAGHSLDRLESWLADSQRLLAKTVEADLASQALGDSLLAVKLAMEEAEAAEAASTVATVALEELRSAHSAAHLRSALMVGEPCPVCDRPVEKLSKRKLPKGLEKAQAERDLAAERWSRAQPALRKAETEAVAVSTAAEKLAQLIEDLTKRLAGAPAQRALGQLHAVAVELTRDLASTRQKREAAAAALAKVTESARTLDQEMAVARLELQRRLREAADLEPPLLDVTDLAQAWHSLAEFVTEKRPALAARRELALETAASCRAQRAGLEEQLLAICREEEIWGSGPVRDAVVASLATLRAEQSRQAHELGRIEGLRADLAQQTQRAIVAKALSGYLGSRNFVAWVLDEAVAVLVAGANQRLAGLAGGQYSLAVDKHNNFEVIDHFAAGLRRSVRSLSGGETFLVSLALALSLSDHVSEMSASGMARIESIFLDEGFGALDSDTLQTVADVINELAASGRTVGIVTHVSELAAQLPVQFAVEKAGSNARVSRLDGQLSTGVAR
jgi:exonuclease SbcC